MNRLTRLLIIASLFLVTAAVNLEVPLYLTYAQIAGYGIGQTAIVFAAYIAGLLPVLILFGGISDRIGRKPVIMAGLAAATLATGIMLAVPTIQALVFARFFQGIGVGLSVGAGTAYLAEQIGGTAGPTWAASLVAAATSVGFGSGALLTSGALLHAKTLAPFSYWIVFALAVLCLACELWLPPQQATGGPLVRLPYFPAGTVPAGLAIATAWAVTGLVITVVPDELAVHHLAAWSASALFLVNGTGALFQPMARRMEAGRSLRVGYVLLLLGYCILVAGSWLGLLPVVLLGAAVCGSACYGFTYLGGLAVASARGGQQRARAVSGYYLFAYLGFGIPSVGVGFVADRIGSLWALVAFGAVILIACAGLFAQSVRQSGSPGHQDAA